MTHLAAIAEVAGMMQDWPRPRAVRASSRAGNCTDLGAPRTKEVSPMTHDQTTRLICITGVPPILSATTPRGICMTSALSIISTEYFLKNEGAY